DHRDPAARGTADRRPGRAAALHLRAVQRGAALPADAGLLARRRRDRLRGQHQRPVQPLAAAQRRRLPAPADRLRGPDRPRGRLVAGRRDPGLRGGPRRRRVQPDLSPPCPGWLAGGADRRAGRAALPRGRPVLPRRPAVDLCRQRPQPDRPGRADPRPRRQRSRPAGRQRHPLFPGRLVSRRPGADGGRDPQQHRLGHPAAHPRRRGLPPADGARGRGQVLPRTVGGRWLGLLAADRRRPGVHRPRLHRGRHRRAALGRDARVGRRARRRLGRRPLPGLDDQRGRHLPRPRPRPDDRAAGRPARPARGRGRDPRALAARRQAGAAPRPGAAPDRGLRRRPRRRHRRPAHPRLPRRDRRGRPHRAGAGPLPDPRRAGDSRLALPAHGRRPVPGRALDPRRSGVAGAAALRRALPAPPQPGDRCAGAERPWQHRLRQGLPDADPPRLGRRRIGRLQGRRRVPARPALGRRRPAGGLRRVVRRLRHALVREPPARVLGGRGRHRRPVEPGHVRQGGPADLAADDGGLGGRPGDGSGLPPRALADHLRRRDPGAALRDPGRQRPARRQGRERPDRRAAALPRRGGPLRRLRGRGPRLHQARQQPEGQPRHRRLLRRASAGGRGGGI
ncbi:MAG: acylamino-acid-releasing enzyme, partial [uncultured Thermomicrobiales bacterium]